MPGGARRPLGGIESAPVVGDLGVELAVRAPHADAYAPSARMAPGVRQRLAKDAQRLGAGCPERTGGNPASQVQLDLRVDRDRAVHGDERFQQLREQLALLAAQAQVVDRRTQLLARALERRPQLVRWRADAAGAAGTPGERQR